jgi:hypothetical protein
LASALVDEERVLEENLGEFPDEPVKMTPDAIRKVLEADDQKQRSRFAYYNAYRMVRHLDEEFGREKLQAMIKSMADGGSVDDAAREAYQMSYDDLVVRALEWPDPRGGDS